MASYTDLNRNVRLVHDLVWLQAVDDDHESVREAAGDAHKVARVVNSYGTIMVGQYLPKLDPPRKGKRLVSFAALMAIFLKEERHALVCLELGPGVAAMVGIVNGLPLPDTDRYGLRENVIKMAVDFLSDYPEATVYGNIKELDSGRLKSLEIEKLLQEKNASKWVKAAEIRPLAGTSKLTWVIALALVLFAAYVGYDHYQSKKKAAASAQSAVQEKSPEQRYAEGLSAAIEQEGMSIVAARQMFETLNTMTLLQAGWRVSRLQCNRGGCAAVWVRLASTSSFEDLVQALGQREVVLQPDQTGLQTIAIVIPNAEKQDYPDPKLLPQKQQAWVDILSPLQKTAGRINFVVDAGAPFPVEGITIPGAIHKTELNLRGPLWVDSYLKSLPPWVMIREFLYEIPGSDKFEGVNIDAKLIFFTKD
jgi:hypothetical protein